MKAIFSILLFAALVVVSCKKETVQPENSGYEYTTIPHHVYVYGKIKDSLDQPAAGYTVTTYNEVDTVKPDGSYFIKYTWFEGGYANPGSGAYYVTMGLTDPSGNHVTNLSKFKPLYGLDNDTLKISFLF